MIDRPRRSRRRRSTSFVVALRDIVATAQSNPQELFDAPVTTVVGRVDEDARREATRPSMAPERLALRLVYPRGFQRHFAALAGRRKVRVGGCEWKVDL